MLVQRRRRWTNIRPTLGQHLVFAGMPLSDSNILVNNFMSWAYFQNEMVFIAIF